MSRRGLLAVVLLTASCSKSQMVDRAMSGAPHPSPLPATATHSAYKLLAGDMHCHVRPPDSEAHVTRELPLTVKLAREEGLDFVVLTPHVPARFTTSRDERRWVSRTQRMLRDRVAATDASDVVLVPGMEYTDHRFGHVGVAFADLDAVLAETPEDAPPERFFERWVARGGVLTINHPVLKPLAGAPFAQLRADLSWRGFDPTQSVPSEMAWVTQHAHALETFNLSVTHLRDQFMVGDVERSLREATSVADRASRDQKRKIAAVGGTDSHGDYLRATTWVLAKEKTKESIAEAIASARTCVRGPEACSFEARAAGEGEKFQSVGTAILARDSIEARAVGGPVRIVVNGATAARAAAGEIVRVPVPETCALVRAIVDASWSSPIYVNCLWAR